MKTMIALSVCAVGAGMAHAGELNMHLVDTGAGRNVKISFYDGETLTDSVNVFAGELVHRISGATGRDAALNGDHITFCPDVLERTTTTPTVYRVVNVEELPIRSSMTLAMGQARADAIKMVYGDAAARMAGDTMSNNFAAAFQLMVWEIVNDYDAGVGVASLDLGAGSLRFSQTNGGGLWAGLLTEFNALKDRIASGADLFQGLTGIAAEGFQDQIVLIPTPATVALAGLGGLLLAGKRRR